MVDGGMRGDEGAASSAQPPAVPIRGDEGAAGSALTITLALAADARRRAMRAP